METKVSLQKKLRLAMRLLRESEHRKRGSLPLSYAQERMWLGDLADPGGDAYIVPGALKLKGELDVGALERSIGELVRRHEILRTRYESEGGEPRQVIEEARGWRLEVEE